MTVGIPKANTEKFKKGHILKILTRSHFICFQVVEGSEVSIKKKRPGTFLCTP